MATPTFLTGGQVQLNWTQNPTAGAYAVKGYSLYRVTGGGNTLVTTTTTPATSYTLTLAPGNNTYVVNAYNDAGPSGNSGTVTVNTALPSTPTQNALSNVSATSATVNWTASTVNANAAAITGYQVLVGVDGAAPSAVATTGAATLSQAVTIVAGHSYVFQVMAQSASGTTVASNSVTLADVVPNAVAAPTINRVTRNNPASTDSVRVTWTAPATVVNGLPVTTYYVDYSADSTFATGVTTQTYTGANGNLPATGSNTTTTFASVVRGTTAPTASSSAYFRVRAVNAAGTTTGASLTVSSATTPAL
jgi:chitin-binding protein